MFIDQKGRLFGKVSIIDLLIVLVLIAAVAGVGYKYSKSKTPGVFVKTDDIRMELYAEEVYDYAAKAIKPGDIVKDDIQKTVLGTVREVKVDKAVSYAANSNGEIVQSSRPNYSSIRVTLEGKGIYSSSGVNIGNVDYFIGLPFDRLTIGNSIFKFNVKISDLKKK